MASETRSELEEKVGLIPSADLHAMLQDIRSEVIPAGDIDARIDRIERCQVILVELATRDRNGQAY